MYQRLGDLPVLDRYPSRISAAVWNLWRRYRRHAKREEWIALEGLPPMSLRLSDREWVVLDASLNDLPILAWGDFQSAGRTALQDPVPCTVRHYHQGASKIRDRVLRLLADELESRLRRTAS